LSVGSLIRSAYLLYFSQPAGDRVLFKAMKKRPIRSIVELGISSTGRTKRLLEVAAWNCGTEPLRYAGIDLFEARPAGKPGPSLKAAFADLRLPDVKVQLVPGEPHLALRRVANSLTGTDLLLIAADQDAASLAQAWTWMPRMLTPESLIFREEAGTQAGTTIWRPLTLEDVQKLAAETGRALRRAA
jgi:hypothetical protein